jgi:D-glycerate 3-kinase
MFSYPFSSSPKRIVQASTDDFYKTREELDFLAQGDNSLFHVRGNPGTIDTKLMDSTVQSLLQKYEPGREILIPRFDKSLFNGKGDRIEKEKWTKVDYPVDIVFLEGWCLGFKH